MRAIAQREMDDREIEGREIAGRCLFLQLFDRRQRGRAIARRAIGVAELCGRERRRLHRRGFLQRGEGRFHVAGLDVDPAEPHLGKEEG